jgi:polyhydroxyalkanoate synthesis repressor PhaR
MRPSPSDRSPDAPRTRVIKRYANRKLYDTRDSRYVTLQQIAEHVRAGEEVSIIDNTTKEDLTNVTLAQIVYEEERRSEGEARRTSPAFDTLRNLIQNGGTMLQSGIQTGGERIMSTLREGPMGKLMPKGREADEEVKVDPAKVADTKEPETKEGQEFRARLLASPKAAFDELQRLADDRLRSVLGIAIGHVQQLQGEVKRLHGRIEELEHKLVAAQKRNADGRKTE